MNIAAKGQPNQVDELRALISSSHPIIPLKGTELGNYDIIFDLDFDDTPEQIGQYIHLENKLIVLGTVKIQLEELYAELGTLPKTTIIGMNALPTFINRPLLECCATNKNDEAIAAEKLKDLDLMMIYPAVHYTMGGVWVDYNLMTTIPGCFAVGEANFSDHGANRLGASALMQGLADGYFVLPYTIGDYLADDIRTGSISTDSKEFEEAEKSVKNKIELLVNNKGTKSVDYFHKKLGKIIWNKCGMSRNAKELNEAIEEIQMLREDFYKNISIPGSENSFNEPVQIIVVIKNVS